MTQERRTGQDRRADQGQSPSTLMRQWGPWIFQIIVLIGMFARMQQQVADVQAELGELRSEVTELRAHVWH